MTELTIRKIRLKLGMTKDEMAEEINVPKSSYKYWESRNKIPEEYTKKIYKLYDEAKEYMVDDGIDIVEKICAIKRYYKLSYERLAHLVGAKQGTSVVDWMNGMHPRIKFMIRINELYYKIVDKKRKTKAGSSSTFCQINPLDKNSWKVKAENKVILWK